MRTKKIAKAWLTVTIGLTMVNGFSVVSAAEETTSKWTLIGESYENGVLIRHYQDENMKDIPHFFDMPEHLRTFVEEASDSTLEAKKRLTTYYTLAKDEEMLRSLENIAIPENPAKLSVTNAYENSFQQDTVNIGQFVEAELKKENIHDLYEVESDTSSAPIDSKEVKAKDSSSLSFGTIISVLAILLGIFGIVIVLFKRR